MAAVRDSRGQISAAQTVDPSEAGNFVDVQMNPQGEAIMLWGREAGGATEVLAAEQPLGGRFGAPLLISPSGGPGTLAVDDRGDAIVGFGTSAVVRPPGGSFSTPVPVPSASIIPAGNKLTALLVDPPAVRVSDLVF